MLYQILSCGPSSGSLLCVECIDRLDILAHRTKGHGGTCVECGTLHEPESEEADDDWLENGPEHWLDAEDRERWCAD